MTQITAPVIERMPAPSFTHETDAPDETVGMCIPGQAEYISVARQAADALGAQLHMSPDERMALTLAVGEACNNAVLHASPLPSGGPAPRIALTFRVAPAHVEIDVKNQSEGFHPVGDKGMPDALAESGRGIPLLHMLMDSVEFRSESGTTVVRMRKRRPGAGT